MSSNLADTAAIYDSAGAAQRARDCQSTLSNPSYQELVRSRNRLAWTLSIAILVVYFGFILLVAFDKPLLAGKIGGGTTSVGIVVGLVVIVLAFVFTAIYVVQANGRFDDLTTRLKRDLAR